MTVEELAEKAGLAIGTISGIENQTAGYSPESLDSLARALDIPPGWILSMDPNGADDIWHLWHHAEAEDRANLLRAAHAFLKPRS